MKLFNILVLTVCSAVQGMHPAKPSSSQPVDNSLSALASQIEDLKFFIADITKSRDDESKHLLVSEFNLLEEMHRILEFLNSKQVFEL